MKVLHIADMTDFHKKINSVIYQSVIEENNVGIESVLYSNLLKRSDKENFLIGNDINIYNYIFKFRPDLIIFHSLYKINNIKLFPLVRVLGIKYIIRPHGSLSENVIMKNRLKKRFSNFLFFNGFISKSSGCLFLSKGEFEYSFNKKVKPYYLPNMVYKAQLDDNAKKENKIIFIGKVEKYYKNMNFIIDVINSTDLGGYMFEIYGPIDESYECEFKSKIKYSDSISYKGEVYGEDKNNILNTSKGLLLLSTSEGMPMVILEALNNGIPCFISKETNMAEFIKGGGVGVVTSLDLESASIALKKFLCLINEDLDNSLSVKCRELVDKEFVWDGSRIRSLYMDIIK